MRSAPRCSTGRPSISMLPPLGFTRPEMARKVRLEGTVVLRAIIDETGRVTAIRVGRQPGVNAGFVEAAREAVSQWRYEPGLYGGEPVAVSMTVVVEFTLQ